MYRFKDMRQVLSVSAFIIIFFSSFSFCSNLVFAEITHPYTVDEKPQVLFSDSAQILVPNSDHTATTTYKGLENYAHDYVNGYAHFTFTYTHNRIAYASYPPYVHVTEVDPRSTSTLAVRYSYAAYWIFGEGVLPTDWYLYDIQFDATGFNVVVKRAGETEVFNSHTDIPGMTAKDWVAIANNHITINGPAHSMSFTPVPISEVPLVQAIDPVIIIPGIMGSATKNGKLVIDPILHTYDDLIDTLKANGYVEGKDLFTFPYEWRDSNVQSANLLKDKINEVKSICGCLEVDLVAHSMGGLVAREYIQSGQYGHDVDQAIFLGTPHKGAPKAYLIWEAGEFTGETTGLLLKIRFSIEATKQFYSSLFSYIKGRPILSVQELLPTFDYLKDKDTEALRIYPNNYPRNTFLEYLNSSSGIQNLLNSNVKITNIVGNIGNTSTIEKIRVIDGLNSLWIDGKPDGFDNKTGDRGLEMGGGDGTVTINGATIDSSITNIVSISEHTQLPTIEENNVFNILTNKTSITDIHRSLIEKIFTVQLNSPIDVVITDPDGKKIGKNFVTGEEYNEISGAFYSGFNNGDNEYITIPNPIDGNYRIEVQGTDNGGKYGVLASYISDSFATTTEVVGITKPNQITQLDVTVNNQNPLNFDTERKITLEVLINDINGAYDLKWIKDTKTRDALIKQVNGAIKFNKKIDIIKEKQPGGSIKEKRVERFETKVNKILVKLFTLELQVLLKKKTITQDAFNLIKSDVDYLINN